MPFCSAPLKVVVPAGPTVSVAAPVPLLVMLPLEPLRGPTVGLKPPRSTTPPLTVSPPMPKALVLPTCSVPPLTVVPPE